MMEVVSMNAITLKSFRKLTDAGLTTRAKIVLSYGAAYLTAFAVIGLFYLTGIFDVGFLAGDSLALKVVHLVQSIAG